MSHNIDFNKYNQEITVATLNMFAISSLPN